MPYGDRMIWEKEIKATDTYCRFFHRDIHELRTNQNIKRVPWEWSGFGRYKGFAFFHVIYTVEDEFLYKCNNPVAHVQGVKLRHFRYNPYIEEIVDLTRKLTFMEMMRLGKRESYE